MTYELHPLCTLFPRLNDSEFLALVADIKSHGLRQSIVLHDGMILDGGNRYRACLEAGVEPAFSEFAGENIVSFVLSANLHRRHLSPGQQAAIVASAQDWATAQSVGRPGSDKWCNVAPFSTASDRAAESGASLRTQKMADKVAKADPELAKQVAHGEISLPKAVEKIDPKPVKPAEQARDDELAEAQHTISDLSQEIDALKDRIAVESMDGSEEAKTQAAETIRELRGRIKTLEAELAAVKRARDGFMREASEAKKQAVFWRKKAEAAA